jgi:methyl-accepting chemotaxis protein
MSDDRRGKVRRTLRIKAHLLCDGDIPELVCTLVDISETGARLTIEEASEVPDEFILVFTANGTPRRKCRVVWRHDADIGVAFEIEKPNRERPRWASREEALSVFGLHS